MKKYITLILLSIFYFNGTSTQHEGPSEKSTYKTPQKIVEELSGATKLENGVLIENRSSFKNREHTRKYLVELIQQAGLVPEVQEYALPNLYPIIDLLFHPFKGANVYTVLPATTKSEEYITLGAHFDTELNCPGAIDNATGVALIYSVLVELSKSDKRQKNIIVVFFDQEEENLNGSQAFAKYLKENKFKVHSVHTFDTIGWDNDNDFAMELELPTKYLEKVYRKNAAALNIPLYVSPSNSTDHHSFRELGYNAIGLTDEYYNGDYPPHKDTSRDKFETVNFEYLQSCTQLVTATIKDIVK